MNDKKKYKEDLIFILKKLEVKHEIINPNSSQSNEKAKWLNWILKEYIKVMLYQMNILKFFWIETIIIAIYILNHLSNDIINNISYKL